MPYDEKSNSADIAMWYRDIPFTLDEITPLEENVTRECWRYLVGKYCKRENDERKDTELVRDIYKELGDIFGYLNTSLKKVVTYAGAIDRIHRLLPNAAYELLNGEVKMSVEDTIAVSMLMFHEINDIMFRRKTEKTMTKKLISEQKALRIKPERRGRPKRGADEIPRISIKDAPAPDPDAQINTLAYTIPSWIGMMERTFDGTDFKGASVKARSRLVEELNKLLTVAETLTVILSEVDS